MKKILLVGFFCLLYNSVFSQDLIIMLKGDTLKVNIIKNLPETVEFNFQNETLTNVEYKKYIQKIIYINGRIQICNEIKELPKIESEEDWEKVIITFEENDIIGLIDCGTIEGASNWGGLASVKGGENAIKEMKIKAAKIGASIILITRGWHKEKNKPLSGYGRGVSLAGKAYKTPQ